MDVLYQCCCGLDVHAKIVVACLIKDGQKQTRTFATMTEDLLALADWLGAQSCTHVAVESTGVYWRPVFNLLEGLFEVILVNARHMKAVPGRKTDVRDSEWLADLLRHGLLKASFIPPHEIREVRELTRYRQTLVKSQAAVTNRIHRILECGNIKLGQVASDVMGVSGRLMVRALAAGETNGQTLAAFARGQLKRKTVELRRALTGRLSTAQRFVLQELLDRYDELEKALERVNGKIEQEIATSPEPALGPAVELVQTIPGVGRQVAEVVVAEIGVDMTRFPTAKHLASWAGMCPGSYESAGKSQSGKTRQGSKNLRTALVQAAWAATHTKGTYLAAQYRRLVKRKGRKKALVAVGHSLLVIVFHLLARHVAYQELGEDYFERQHTTTHCRRLLRQLEALGMRVTVEPHPAAV